jgi:hypothetical protein
LILRREEFKGVCKAFANVSHTHLHAVRVPLRRG